jgi:glycosyltransferase involved in cell wall biosynthesis
MRILHLCKMDAGGGAADGFMRIHDALLSQGVDSTAYVMKKRRSAAGVIDASKLLGPAGSAAWLGRRFASKLRRVGQRVEGVFDFDAEGVFPAEPIIAHAQSISSKWDVVLVHWLGGYMSPESVVRIADALHAKIGLWQVDMAHMTGGCHYSLACDRYREGCGRCPALGSVDEVDVTLRQAATRADAWCKSGAVVLAQSHWSARKAAESHVLRGLRQAVLPIPLDLERLPETADPLPSRRRLGLPTDGRRVALVRPVDPGVAYKGFGVFQEALRRLDRAGVRLHVAGAGPAGLFPAGMKHVSFTDLGHLSGDAAMSDAYQAADFFVCPSIDDAGPMMVPEAMASGRPVLSTSVGIAQDLIIEGKNGSLCGPPGDPEALYLGLRRYAELAPDVLRSQGLAAAETRGTLSRARFVERLTEAFRE